MSASGLAAHLSPAELGQRYRAARSPVERSHLQIVWLLSRGRSEREVAQVTGYGRRWVGEVARRYDEGGPDGLGDRRRGNAGATLASWASRSRLCANSSPSLTSRTGPAPRSTGSPANTSTACAGGSTTARTTGWPTAG